MTFEKKLMENGTINPNYVDLLDEDREISSQKFCCVSFVSPENIIKQKRLFQFEKFLKYYEFDKAMQKYHNFLNYVSYKYDFNFDELMKEFSTFVEEEKKELLNTSIEDDYKKFLDNQGDKVDKEFNELHNFQTNTRGLKIRGSFPTYEEAAMRAKLLREKDPNHDIYVGEVGKWMPFNPDAFKTGKVEYLEEELNAIMNYKANQEDIDRVNFDERVKSTKQKAIEENIEKAKETGNKLTQRLDETGELQDNIEVKNIQSNTDDETLSTNLINDVIRGDNINRDRLN